MHLVIAFARIVAEDGGGNLLQGLGINLVQLLAQIVNFLLVVYFLNGILIRPILRNLEARRKRLEDGLENARLAGEASANADKAYQDGLKKAVAEANKMRADMLADAQAEVQHIHANAQAEAVKIRAAARADALVERNQLLADSRSQIVSLVMAATDKLIGDSLDENRQRALIDEFLAKVPAANASGAWTHGGPVVVTSAVPLTQDEQALMKADLSATVDSADTFTFEVDPGILGGMVVRVGDKVLDGSISGKIASLRQQLTPVSGVDNRSV